MESGNACHCLFLLCPLHPPAACTGTRQDQHRSAALLVGCQCDSSFAHFDSPCVCFLAFQLHGLSLSQATPALMAQCAAQGQTACNKTVRMALVICDRARAWTHSALLSTCVLIRSVRSAKAQIQSELERAQVSDITVALLNDSRRHLWRSAHAFVCCVTLVLDLLARHVSRVWKPSSRLPKRPSGTVAQRRARSRKSQRPCRLKRLLSRQLQAISASFMRAQSLRATRTRSCDRAKPAAVRARRPAFNFNRKKMRKMQFDAM